MPARAAPGSPKPCCGRLPAKRTAPVRAGLGRGRGPGDGSRGRSRRQDTKSGSQVYQELFAKGQLQTGLIPRLSLEIYIRIHIYIHKMTESNVLSNCEKKIAAPPGAARRGRAAGEQAGKPQSRATFALLPLDEGPLFLGSFPGPGVGVGEGAGPGN